MLHVLIYLMVSIVLSFAGEVEELDFYQGHEFSFYGDESARVTIAETQHNQRFTLSVQQYRIVHSVHIEDGHQVDDAEYRNIVLLRYNRFRLDTIKFARIHSLKNCEVDDSMIKSVHPVMPPPDIEEPEQITVYFSMVDNTCTCKIYGLRYHYEKTYNMLSEENVDVSKCSVPWNAQ